jgi:transposase
MNDGKVFPELRTLIQIILKESDQNVREIRHDRLKSILKQEFGVRYPSKAIKKVLQDGRWTLNLGWGRGEDYLRRIPQTF